MAKKASNINPNSKKKSIKVADKKKRILLILTAAVFIGLGAYTVKSAFALSDIKICNSSASETIIKAYKTDNSWSVYLGPDQCSKWVNNTGSNPVRVNTMRSDSYKLGKIEYGYGSCHSGSNSASNPPDDAPYGVRYRTYVNSTVCN